MPARSRRAAPLRICCFATRPKAGVVAASGGNHGAAVAYAAMRLGAAGADLRADRLVPGQDRPDPLVRRGPDGDRRTLRGSAGREHRVGVDLRRAAGARVRSDRNHRRPGHARPRALEAGAAPRHGSRRRRRRRPDRRHRRLVRLRPPASSPSSPKARRRCSRRSKAGRPVDAPTGSVAADSLAPRQVGAADVPDRAGARRPRRPGHRRCDPRRRSGRCGRDCASSPSRAAARRSRRCCPARISPPPASASASSSAARTRRRSISDDGRPYAAESLKLASRRTVAVEHAVTR